MIQVATHLRDHACLLESIDEVDLFGRSAFNRFYYACYWKIRTTFPRIVPDWKKLGHKSLPDYFATTVKSETLKTLDRQWKRKLIQDDSYGRLKSRIEQSITQICMLMKSGYSIRCDADYEPDLKTTKIGDSLILNGRKLSAIEALHRDITRHVGILEDCRKELGL